MRIAFVLPGIEIEFEGQAFRRLPVRQETDRLGVLLAQPVIAGMALLPFVTARDPACKAAAQRVGERSAQETFQFNRIEPAVGQTSPGRQVAGGLGRDIVDRARSEEHTSELQSLMRISYAVFCLKKKKKENQIK